MSNDVLDQDNQLADWVASLLPSTGKYDAQDSATQQTPNPHDQFFRKMMADREIAQRFLQKYLPCDIVAAIDWDLLKLRPTKFVSNWWKDLESDIIYQIKLRGHEGYLVLLIEHQSTPDKLLPYRVEKYKHQCLEQYMAQNPKAQLPLIFPLVLYNGKRRYNYSTDIRDLIAGPRDMVDKYYAQPLSLIDLSAIDDQKLLQDKVLSLLLITMKHIYNTNQDVLVRDILNLCSKVYNTNQKKLVRLVIEYMLIAGEVEDEVKFSNMVCKELSKQEGVDAMSLGQRLLDRGMQQGMLQGQQEGQRQGLEQGMQKGRKAMQHEIAKNMHLAGFSAKQIKQATGLDVDSE